MHTHLCHDIQKNKKGPAPEGAGRSTSYALTWSGTRVLAAVIRMVRYSTVRNLSHAWMTPPRAPISKVTLSRFATASMAFRSGSGPECGKETVMLSTRLRGPTLKSAPSTSNWYHGSSCEPQYSLVVS